MSIKKYLLFRLKTLHLCLIAENNHFSERNKVNLDFTLLFIYSLQNFAYH